MRRRTTVIIGAVASIIFICLAGSRTLIVQGRPASQASFAAIPGEKGGQDFDGPYEVVG
jgi:hypothetical protein